MPLSNPYVLLAIVMFYLGSLGLVGHKAYNLGQEHLIATQTKERSIEDRTRTAALQAAADEIAKIKVTNEYRTQRLATETVEKPVYRDCVNTDASFGLLNESLTAPEDRHDTGDGSVPKLTPLTDKTFGATVRKLKSVADQYYECRAAALSQGGDIGGPKAKSH